MADLRKDLTGKKAMEFVKTTLKKGYRTGNYLFEIGKWLAEDPVLRSKLVRVAEDILINPQEKIVVIGCQEFLKKIDFGRDSEMNRKDLGNLLDANPRTQSSPSPWNTGQ